jgi:hypothetical protein
VWGFDYWQRFGPINMAAGGEVGVKETKSDAAILTG